MLEKKPDIPVPRGIVASGFYSLLRTLLFSFLFSDSRVILASYFVNLLRDLRLLNFVEGVLRDCYN